MIAYAIPGTYTYRVILGGELGDLICGDMMNVSFTRSVRISQLYPVGTRVLVLKQHGLHKGMIIGSPAREVLDNQYAQPVLSSAIGSFHVVNRQYVKNVIKSPDIGRGIPDYVQGRAVDVCEGDYMVSNMSEGGFFTSPFETSIRQNHDCGVWMFSMDRLLRVVGQSIQEYSMAHERYVGMDEHETHGYEGTAGYPWEALGYYAKPEQPWKKHTGTEVINGKGISFVEPAVPAAEPFYRRQVFTGFLGQGFTQEIRIPPKGIAGQSDGSVLLHDPNDTHVPIVVSRQQMLPDGTLIHESTRAIHFVKHPNIRSFKRKHAIDDPRGDDMREIGPDAYEFSGGKELGVMPKSETDQILWAVRKQSPSLFKAHKKDFIEIGKEQQPFEKDVTVPDLNSLRYQDSLDPPSGVELEVDRRYGRTEYQPGRSSISQLENGDILREQATRTEEVNEYIRDLQAELFQQIESIESLGCTAEGLTWAVKNELEELAGHDKWL